MICTKHQAKTFLPLYIYTFFNFYIYILFIYILLDTLDTIIRKANRIKDLRCAMLIGFIWHKPGTTWHKALKTNTICHNL